MKRYAFHVFHVFDCVNPLFKLRDAFFGRFLPELRKLYEYQTQPVGNRFSSVAINYCSIYHPLCSESPTREVCEGNAYHRIIFIIPFTGFSLLRHSAAAIEKAPLHEPFLFKILHLYDKAFTSVRDAVEVEDH